MLLFAIVLFEGCCFRLGTERLQNRNKTSVSGVIRLVSCIICKTNLPSLTLDHEPSACYLNDAWRSEGLPALSSEVVSSGWDPVVQHLREVCVHLGVELFPRSQAHEFGNFCLQLCNS
jgi:hypothetical protein